MGTVDLAVIHHDDPTVIQLRVDPSPATRVHELFAEDPETRVAAESRFEVVVSLVADEIEPQPFRVHIHWDGTWDDPTTDPRVSIDVTRLAE